MIYRMSWIAVSLTMVALIAGCGGNGGRQDVSATSTAVTHSSLAGPAQGQTLLGDLDNDGNPTVGDAILILRIVVGLDADNPCADANQSGGTDVGDAIRVLRCLVGLDTWPIGVCDGAEGLYSAYVVGASWLYEESLPSGNVDNVTFTMVGTYDIRGVECIDLRVDDPGGPMMHVYATVSEADGAYVYALGGADGTISDLPDTPSQWLPGSPPADYVTTSTLFPLNGTYDGHAVSTAATVETPSGTYNNALQAQLTCRDQFTTGVPRMTVWLVPGIGMVRILLEYPGSRNVDVKLVSYTPAP